MGVVGRDRGRGGGGGLCLQDGCKVKQSFTADPNQIPLPRLDGEFPVGMFEHMINPLSRIKSEMMQNI